MYSTEGAILTGCYQTCWREKAGEGCFTMLSNGDNSNFLQDHLSETNSSIMSSRTNKFHKTDCKVNRLMIKVSFSVKKTLQTKTTIFHMLLTPNLFQ